MKCSICGNESSRKVCTSCDFWGDIVKEKERHPICRGNAYYLSDDLITTTNTGWNGFGGQWFKIIFADGRILYTNNLWHNGTVPVNWRDKLPDNCTIESKIDKAELESLKNIKQLKLSQVFEKGMQNHLAEAYTTSFFE